MENRLVNILRNRQQKAIKGVYCACTANETVLKVCLRKAKESKTPLVIEATSNQVNQYGGYTGMTPRDYRSFIEKLAVSVDYPVSEIILGGDHLGPLTYSGLPEEQAMAEAKELVRQFTLAGFTKLHLDTSMRLKSDDLNQPLTTLVIAKRGAELAAVAESAYLQLLQDQPEAEEPCYIIGSEVPLPGGEQEDCGLRVTRAADFVETVNIYKQVFFEAGLAAAFKRVVAVVVQPGVEFGDETIHEYNSVAAGELISAIEEFPDFVFEGHSTDYQRPQALRQMVSDNVAILKVGPALTFAYRQGLFALAKIEEELFSGVKPLSNLIVSIEELMLAQPENWQKYYHGSPKKQELARKYSFSDRLRYYLPQEKIVASIQLLLANFRDEEIPLTLLSQYMSEQYKKVRAGTLINEAQALVEDFIAAYIDDYLYAITTD